MFASHCDLCVTFYNTQKIYNYCYQNAIKILSPSKLLFLNISIEQKLGCPTGEQLSWSRNFKSHHHKIRKCQAVIAVKHHNFWLTETSEKQDIQPVSKFGLPLDMRPNSASLETAIKEGIDTRWLQSSEHAHT